MLDRDGRPVMDLSADDFVLEEDGVRQRIQSFQLLGLSGAVAPGDDRSLEITSQAHAASELARDDVRVFLVFWDEYHIPPHYQSQRLRQALIGFLRELVQPTDLVAVMDQWTPMSDLRFSRDRAVLWNTALTLRGRQGEYAPRNVAEENHLREMGRIESLRSQVSLSALHSAMMHLGTLRPGRTTILYLGREFGLGRDSAARTTELVQAANDNNVALYSVSPDGLDMRGMRYGILGDLARNTGGEALVTNVPDQVFKRAVQQMTATYLLGYAPEPLRRDGKFHKVKVGVRRGGLQVRARNGYWAPDIAMMTRAKTTAAEAVMPSAIEAALGELARLDHHDGDIPLALETVLEPEEPSPVLHLPRPRLWSVRRPAELREATSDAPPPPSAGREFTRADRLIVRIRLEGSAAADGTVTAALIDRRGKRLTALPVSRPGLEWMLDLPLASIARGDYVIAIEGQARDARTAAYLPLRVKS